MPRRSSTRFQLQSQLSSSPPPPQSVNGDHLSGDLNPMLQLRTQWKWAAFSQFFFTFNHLFAMNDVSLNDIESDLVSGSSVVVPRIMQRLLYTLSYDRKVSLDNWQTALRKQYRKRDPAANPIGPEPREATPEPEQEESKEEDVGVLNVNKEGAGDLAAVVLGDDSEAGPSDESEPPLLNPETTHLSTLERGASESIVGSKAPSAQPSGLNTRAGTVDGTEREETQAPSDQPGVEDQDESKNWLELPMLAKLESMHILTEWQFQNPTRLRTLMRSDDDAATWRIEPIGYDSKKNAYWLIGADRLWIQHPIPRPPRPRQTAESLKRKRSGNTAKILARKSSKSIPGSKSVKRPRLQTESSPLSSPSKTSGRGSRAAKNEANLKLDQQAKELAALNKQAKTEAGLRTNRRSLPAKGGGLGGSMTTRSNKRGGDSSPPKSMGTRVSRRLRGSVKEDDEWQAVPEEWLNGEGSSSTANGKGRKSYDKGKAKAEAESEAEAEDEEFGDGHDENEDDRRAGKKIKTGLESDGSEISDLTELSDLSEEKAQSRGGDKEAEKDASENSEPMPAVKVEEQKAIVPVPQMEDRGLEEPPVLPVGFIEWETICVTLYEWDHIAERFEKATHYTEKALYKVLVNTIVPVVTEELREIERKHQLSLALTQRKRSSRLLLRQSEKEEAEAAARKRAEEEEKNSRAKRLAARLKKEEEERERRETSREMRRREREEREQREREAKERKAKMAYAVEDARSSDMQTDAGDSNGVGMIKLPLPQSKFNGINNGRSTGSGSGSRTPIGDDWELDCEICHRRGINLDDGTPMMSCGMCSKWQHITCHDRADAHAGRKRRNWDDVEFFCLQCRSKKVGVGGTDSRVNQHPQSGAAVQPLRQSQNPYMVHTAAGTVPYNPNLYMGAIGRANYGVQNPVNGNGISYAREAQRLTPSIPSGHPHQRQVQPQQPYTQPYGSTIAFSHYQPQEGGFTTSSLGPGPYAVSGNTQTYGPQPHAGASTNPYMQYNSATPTTKGGVQLFPASQNRWNVTASTQVPGYPTSMPSYTTTGNTPTHYTQNMAPSVNVQGGSQWHFQHQASAGQQNTTQFQHHSSSYQPPAAPP